MNLKKLSSAIALSGVLSLASAGIAFADDASIENTGPDSTNTATITNSNHFSQTNTSNVHVSNGNHQTASSGKAEVKDNTNAGDAASGNASNSNSFATDVSINNESGLGGGTNAAGEVGKGGAGGGVGGSVSSPASGGAGGGANVSSLPRVGCELVCDVSALRNAYKPFGGDQNATAQARGLSAGLLALATLLSLIGASGSAVYAARRSKA